MHQIVLNENKTITNKQARFEKLVIIGPIQIILLYIFSFLTNTVHILNHQLSSINYHLIKKKIGPSIVKNLSSKWVPIHIMTYLIIICFLSCSPDLTTNSETTNLNFHTFFDRIDLQVLFFYLSTYVSFLRIDVIVF